MKHHYLPQFYLKEFACTKIKSRQTAYLHVYDMYKKKWSRRSPNNIAFINDYYKIDTETENPYFLEKEYQRIEDFASRIIRNKIKTRQEISDEDKGNLCAFVSLFLYRVPYVRKAMEEFLVQIETQRMDMILHDDGLFMRYLAPGIRRLNPNIDNDGIMMHKEILRKAISGWDVKVNKDYLALINAVPDKKIYNMMLSMHWSFIFAQEDSHYVTSDYPCLKPGGLLSNSYLTFPVTPKILLRASWEKITPLYIEATRTEVEDYNIQTIKHSDKFIFASDMNFDGDIYLMALGIFGGKG